MVSLFHHRKTCRLCGAATLRLAVPLNPVPLTSPNIGVTDEMRAKGDLDVMVPVDVWQCETCGHIQLLDVIDSAIQYNNFLYTTSISLGLAEHFGRLAAEVIARAGLKPGDFVVEVGSNDGTLLRVFQQAGMRVLGIDPARETARRATEAGTETIGDFFTGVMGREIRERHGAAKVILSNNTFANLDDVDDVTQGIRALLAPDGLFVFETSYGADVIEKGLLDTIYHEHLSYFSVRPLASFFPHHGLALVDVERIWTKGGSIRGFVQHQGGPHPHGDGVATLIAHEDAIGLYRGDLHRDFASRIVEGRARLDARLDAAEKTGRPIAAYGASVGSVTLIHQFGLSKRLAFIADDTPLGEALSGPGYRIPIVSPQALYDQSPALVVILAWRYAEPIITKHQAFVDQGGEFAVPLPL